MIAVQKNGNEAIIAEAVGAAVTAAVNVLILNGVMDAADGMVSLYPPTMAGEQHEADKKNAEMECADARMGVVPACELRPVHGKMNCQHDERYYRVEYEIQIHVAPPAPYLMLVA